MISKLGAKILADQKGPFVFVGVITGGGFIADELVQFMKLQSIKAESIKISIDTQKEKIIYGEEEIINNDKKYIVVDDAVWSARTISLIKKIFKQKKIVDIKFAVLLDPHKKADYSLYS